MSLDSGSRQIIFKKEVTRGTYLAPTYTTDFDVVVEDLADLGIDAGHNGGSKSADGTMGMSDSLAGRKQATISFWIKPRWSGDVAVAPVWWKLLEGCQWVIDTTGANATATWSGRPSCTGLSADLPLWECGIDPVGVADVMAGMAGTVDFGADEVGAEIKFNFSFTGKVGYPKTLTTGTFQTPSGVDTSDSEAYLGTTIVKGGTAYKAWTWNVAQNGDVQSVNDAGDVTNGASTGIHYHKVVDANPEMTATVTRVAGVDDVTDTFDNVKYASVVITMDHFEITLSEAVQNISVARSNSNETGTDDLGVKFNKIVIKQI